MVQNKNTAPADAPDQTSGQVEAPAKSSYDQAEKAATQKILNENSSSTKNDSSSTAAAGTDTSGLKPTEAGDSGTEATETVEQKLSREATESATEQLRAATKAVGKYLDSSIDAIFGSPSIVDSAEGSDTGKLGKVQDQLQQAKAEKTEKTEKPKDAKESEVGSALTDFSNWVADGFNEYVAKPVAEALSDITDVFDSTSEWMFGNGQNGGSDAYGQVPDALSGLNDVSNREFNQQQREAMNNFNFDLDDAKDQSGEGLRLPENAVESGTIEIGGNKVSVMRTPEGDTYLKRGDKVIGHQKPDGSYELALKDGSTLDFKMSEGEDGKYKLDNLERTKDGKLQQKVADGVFFNYNYDAQGNRTSVDAAGDLKGPLSPEKLAAIKKELGDSGAAALRVTDQDQNTQRLLLQVHDKDTSSLTDIDAKRAQITHNGNEYRLNENDQLGLVDSDGSWKAPEKPETDDPTLAEQIQKQQQRLEELARKLGKRAKGDSDDAIDGVKLRTRPDGTASVTRENPATGEPLTTTDIPADATKPISVVNSNGERTEIRGENIDLRTGDGQRLFEFDQNTGLQTDDITVDRNGLLDRETGALLAPDGNVYDPYGEMIGEGWGDTFGEDCEDCVETAENKTIANSASQTILSLGIRAFGLTMSGNPDAAKNLIAEAIGRGNGALSQVGNDLMAQAPIANALSLARIAQGQATQSDATLKVASNMGVFDSSRQAELNRGINSTTTFSNEEYVRDRLNVA